MSKSREKKITEQRGYQLNLSNYWSKLAHIMYGLIKFAKQSVLCLSTRILLPLFIQCDLSNTHAGGRKGFEIAIVTFTLSVHFQMTKVSYGIPILQKRRSKEQFPVINLLLHFQPVMKVFLLMMQWKKSHLNGVLWQILINDHISQSKFGIHREGRSPKKDVSRDYIIQVHDFYLIWPACGFLVDDR